MDCKNVRDLLMTDYTDGEADVRSREDVALHLRGCEACRVFEEELRQAAIEPFAAAGEIHPPDHVWDGIRSAIEVETYAGPVESPAFRLRDLLVIRRPGLAVAAVAAACVMTAVFLRPLLNGGGAAGVYLEEQNDYLVYLESGENGYNGNGSVDLGTAIEEYLL